MVMEDLMFDGMDELENKVDAGDDDGPKADKKSNKGKMGGSKASKKADLGDGSQKEGAGRMKALEATLTDLTKRFGEGTIVRLGDATHMAVEALPTGSLTVDIALGVGGIPRGRIVEIYGPESSGKTTLCLHTIAEAQKRGGLCAFVDMEHALDPVYAERTIGVDVDSLYISQPDTAEQALEITEALVRSGALDVVVLDSVAALVPRAEIEGEMGDSHVGLQARLMSQALRKLSGAIKQSNVSVLFTNQLREKIGVMFGSPETTTGGRALKFYASVRLDIRRIQSIKQGGDTIGSRTKVRVTKNKVAAPFKEAEFDIMYFENGISKAGEIVDIGVILEIIEKRGAFFRYNDGLLGQGRENAKQFLRDNPAVSDEIEDAIRAHYGLPPVFMAPAK
jgi:recombination protein RecA